MFDMGHHAVHVLLWFLGRPTSVTGVFSCFSETARKNNVDDIAAALYSFPSGAIGIAETGYLCPGGTLYSSFGAPKVNCAGHENRRGSNIVLMQWNPGLSCQKIPFPQELPIRCNTGWNAYSKESPRPNTPLRKPPPLSR